MRVVSTLVVMSIASTFAACAPEGSSAYVSFNVPPDEDCVVSPTSEIFISSGMYDIGEVDTGAFCKRSYFMNLLVNSNLKSNARDSTGRAEPNVLQLMEADVRLMDKDKQTLNFKNKDGSVDTSRPNPFRVQTSNSLRPNVGRDPSMGIAAVEAIPRQYADQLTKFSGDKILVEVQIFGQTTGDVDIDFKPFVYPVSICRGCLSICRSVVNANKIDVYGNECQDNAAADGRYCVDPGC